MFWLMHHRGLMKDIAADSWNKTETRSVIRLALSSSNYTLYKKIAYFKLSYKFHKL